MSTRPKRCDSQLKSPVLCSRMSAIMRRTMARSMSPSGPASTSITWSHLRRDSVRHPLKENSAVRGPTRRIWKIPPVPSSAVREARLRERLDVPAAPGPAEGATGSRAIALPRARRRSRFAAMSADMSNSGCREGAGSGTGGGTVTADGSGSVRRGIAMIVRSGRGDGRVTGWATGASGSTAGVGGTRCGSMRTCIGPAAPAGGTVGGFSRSGIMKSSACRRIE